MTPPPANSPINLADYEALARSRADRVAWDYFAGGSDDETTLFDNVAAFRRRTLRPRVLSGVAAVDLRTTVLGTELSTPVMVAPLGHQRLAHADGELATARAASAAGTLMIASTMASTSLEAIANAAPGPRWFQLYVMKDRGLTASLVLRARASAYRALVVTVDAPKLGRRERDLRNGFSLPPGLAAANLSASAEAPLHRREGGNSGLAMHAQEAFEVALDWKSLEWLASLSPLPIVVKGVLTADDAERAADSGVAGIVVSNHGGRQLDGVPATIDVLEEIAARVGARCEVYVDGGIRRGTDVLKARALGARAVLIGRPILWGLIVDGERGVSSVLGLLRAELELAMLLAGQPAWLEVERTILATRTP
jgi:4-hydroxymandelate oxidase